MPVAKPRLAYAANRGIGLRGLEMLLAAGWRPVVLLVPGGADATGCAEEMRRLLPDVPVLEGRDFRDDGGVRLLRSLALDVLLSVHFPYIVPREVLELSRIGCFNLHPAYLPWNRGWHTPSWTILERTRPGATLHWMAEGMDEGDIVVRRELDVRPEDTAHTLYQRILAVEEDVLQAAIPLLCGGRPPRLRQEQGGTRHVKADLETVRRLDLSEERKVGEMLDLLRALTTSRADEAAYFEHDGVRYCVRVDIRPQDP